MLFMSWPHYFSPAGCGECPFADGHGGQETGKLTGLGSERNKMDAGCLQAMAEAACCPTAGAIAKAAATAIDEACAKATAKGKSPNSKEGLRRWWHCAANTASGTHVWHGSWL